LKKPSSAAVVPYIPFDRAAARPLYDQIYEGYRDAILCGRLALGQRLPSTRSVAGELGTSRFTVVRAFEQLLHEGYLRGKTGSGTFVLDSIPDELAKPLRLHSARLAPAGARETNPAALTIRPRQQGIGPFAVGVPAVDLFPREVWGRLIRRHARIPSRHLVCGDPAGYLPLREAIASYLGAARAVECDARQVLLVSGLQQGLRVAAAALAEADTVACIEDPSYWGAQKALDASVADVIPVAVDREGIDVSRLVNLGARAKMVYVTPAHQYPLGMAMSVPRRLELLEWAALHDGWILEDDYDSEFRYASRPLSALQGMGIPDRVIYLGTFSKVLFPALRIGYIVVPHRLVESCIRIRESFDLFPPTYFQLVLTDFVTDGHFARHIRRMRAVYLSRRNALIAAIQTYAADLMTIGDTDAGLHLVAFLPDSIDDQELVRQARSRGLFPQALSRCYARPTSHRGLILGFGGSDEHEITHAVEALASLIREHPESLVPPSHSLRFGSIKGLGRQVGELSGGG
jgi:GntR family transcriptional regulator / MocR family aminotransferase